MIVSSTGIIVQSSKLELIAPNFVKSGEDFKIICSVILTDEEQQNVEVILKKVDIEFYRYNKRNKFFVVILKPKYYKF
jgi:hypothetical protein